MSEEGSAPDASGAALRETQAALLVAQAEAGQLRYEIASLKEARSWTLGRWLNRWISVACLPMAVLNLPLRLRPLHQATQGEPTASGFRWVFDGNDPQFRLHWPLDLALLAGPYRMSMQIENASERPGTMQLFYDTGHGFRASECIVLRFRQVSSRVFEADFDLPAMAEAVRLDPAETPGEMTIGKMRMRRVTGPAIVIEAARDVVFKRRTRGHSWRTIALGAANAVRNLGPGGVVSHLRGNAQPSGDGADYHGWIARHECLDADAMAALGKQVAELASPPLISVLMPVYNTPEHLLREAIESVRAQVYPHWQLCIADDCSTQPHVRRVLDAYAARDTRIRVIRRTENGHISRASNSALELVEGAWIALLDHDDLLRPNSLAEVALEIARHPDAQLIYSDEDKLGPSGQRYDPYFKPDFSRELFRSQNYLNHLTVHRTENVRAVGGWRIGFEGSQDYDLNLRICERIGFSNIRHIPKVLYHWRAVAGSTAMAGSEKSYAYQAGFRALDEHVVRMGLNARVEEAPGTPFYRLRFEVPDPQPLVSLIIPTRDHVALLRGCISSIRDKTTYRNYEILVVDNGSTDPETLAYLDGFADDPQVRVLRYDKPFNYSAINNFAAEQAQGEILGLINNDIEVISPDWLTEMVSWAVQPDIGCVGAKLYYPNDTIQHAGVILGIGGVAGHSHKYFGRNEHGYFSRLKLNQNLSAVTAACLVIRNSTFKAVGGLDELNLPVAFNDVDLCLRVLNTRKFNVWTPYAELYHLESVSRGADVDPEKIDRFQSEMNYMLKRWKLDKDPYYSASLTLVQENFAMAV